MVAGALSWYAAGLFRLEPSPIPLGDTQYSLTGGVAAKADEPLNKAVMVTATRTLIEWRIM